MYVVLVNLSIAPEHLAGFERAALENAETSVASEPDCHRFEVSQSEDASTEWLFYEVYTDRAAFDFHHRQPHFLAYDAEAAAFVTSKRVTTYVTRGTPSA